MSLHDEQRKYERWWLNRRCRRPFSSEFKLVTKVKVIGPPSGFNAIVVLTYEDGSEQTFGPPPHGGYKPNKSAVEVDGAKAPA